MPLGVRRHDRNISDEQMLGCAATGGVIGINGVGVFLGENDASTAAIVRAIDYAVSVVGPEHVGLGLDYVFDQDELNAYLEANRDTFPPGGGYADYRPWHFVSPKQLAEISNRWRLRLPRQASTESSAATSSGSLRRYGAELVRCR